MAHGSMVEVFPGKLFWAPVRQAPPQGFDGEFAKALDMCAYGIEEGKAPSTEYNVMHYSIKAAGRAFGPLGLDVMLRFCRGLDGKLQSMGDKALAIGTTPGDVNQRTNVAAMFGAFLMLIHGWSVEKVVEKLGKGDADLAFACSWARKDRPEAKRNMVVRDCWDGLDLAIQMGWVDPAQAKSDGPASFLCSKWLQMVTTYDCSWIIPGFILVGADPITTALDPNPATFSVVYPVAEASVPSVAPPAGATSSPDTANSDGSTSAVGEGGGPTESLETVCKEYSVALGTQMTTQDDKALDFYSFLKGAGTTTIIRTNFAEEPGMPKSGGYDAAKFKDLGMAHADVMIVDTHGGLPKKADVEKTLKCCPDATKKQGAVYIHCKGGFGRSMVLACCLAVERLDISGSALLGWVRMVRPGCINTPQQELLIKSFRGRNDVRRFAGLPPVNADGTPAGREAPAKCGCVAQ